MKALLIAAFCISFVLADIDTPVVQCGKATDLITFSSATLSIKPAKGTDNDITLKGTAKDHVELSGVVLHAILGGIEVYQIPIDNSEIYDGGDRVIFKYTNNFPSYTPSGHYQVNFVFKQDGVNVACAGIKFDL